MSINSPFWSEILRYFTQIIRTSPTKTQVKFNAFTMISGSFMNFFLFFNIKIGEYTTKKTCFACFKKTLQKVNITENMATH